ncbi:MAG: YIP1 family protein [Syntrophomonadaceae bacterium]|nr:YIP1 family protein [Syntrophomonadaceae bacterium]
MSLTEAIYGVIFTPKKTLANISRERIWLSGVLIFFIVMVFNLLINTSASGLEQVEQLVAIPANFYGAISIVGIIFSLVMLFVLVGLYNLFGELIYQSTNASGLLASLSFASIPAVFGPPLQYVLMLVNLQILSYIISLGIGIWLIVLQVIAIRESLSISTGQALLLFIIPIVASILIVGGILSLIILLAF